MKSTQIYKYQGAMQSNDYTLMKKPTNTIPQSYVYRYMYVPFSIKNYETIVGFYSYVNFLIIFFFHLI